MLSPVFFISATQSSTSFQFLFLSMKMLPLMTTMAAARGKFYVKGKNSFQNGKQEVR